MIVLRSLEEIELMSAAGRIVAQALYKVWREAAPGVTTGELDERAEKVIRDMGGEPAFKGYRGYPATLCLSLGQEVVHGIPGARRLKPGVVVSVDVGVRFKGYYADAARSFVIAPADDETLRLLRATEAARDAGVAAARVGNRIGDVSNAVQTYAEREGFGVVRDLVGHGIGRKLHEPPEVPNCGAAGVGEMIAEGMCLAIEPMVNAGTWRVETLADGWTVVTADGKPSAHFEHTVAVTQDGPRVLTADPPGAGVDWTKPIER